MVFKKFDEQQVYQVPVIHETGAKLEVGDVFSYNPSTKAFVLKIDNVTDAFAAVGKGEDLYLIAQSDAVTEKTGTAYKSYAIDKTVNLKAGEEKVVAAYRITKIDNVEWEA